MSRFEGQTAVVTGGGSGVGAAIALALAEEKANLCLVGRRPEKLRDVAARAKGFGVQATCYVADLGTETGQRDLSVTLTRDLAAVDILILNAAAFAAGPIAEGKLEEFDRLYQTNVRAPLALVQALLPLLKRRPGQVAFINSSSGIVAKPNTAAYDSSKHALKAIADSLRGEVNAHGVRVLSVYLGRTASEMQEKIHRMEGKNYRPELLLQPEDVAAVVVNALSLPPTAEVTDVHIRPMKKT